MSEAICHNLYQLDILSSAKRIHSYWPLLAKNEVDIRPLLRKLTRDGVKVFLPVMKNAQMHHGLFTTEESMISGPYGILEPMHYEKVPPLNLDAILVPALATDHKGNRIGYGAGIYDRFLATAGCPLISPVFGDQVVSGIRKEPHDVCVDTLVTERSIHHVRTM